MNCPSKDKTPILEGTCISDKEYRQQSLAFHPDKNVDCADDAKKKFNILSGFPKCSQAPTQAHSSQAPTQAHSSQAPTQAQNVEQRLLNIEYGAILASILGTALLLGGKNRHRRTRKYKHKRTKTKRKLKRTIKIRK